MYAANSGRDSNAAKNPRPSTAGPSPHAPGPAPRHIASTCAPAPDPLLDERELNALDSLAQRYLELRHPGPLSRAARALSSLASPLARRTDGDAPSSQSNRRGREEAETGCEHSPEPSTHTGAASLTELALAQVGAAFEALEHQAAELSASDSFILSRLNDISDVHICKLREICLLRSYVVAEAVESYKRADIQIAALEGGLTGIPGLAGIPFNIALATLLGFRAAQSVARFYGYDAKRDPVELAIAGEVFMASLDHSHHDPAGKHGADGDPWGGGGDGPHRSSPIERVMLVGRGVAIKLGTKKAWAEAAGRGLVSAAITRAGLGAARAAESSLVRIGVRETEQAVVRDALRYTGAHATQLLVQRSIPLVSGAIGAYFDAAKIRRTLEYADIFYQKRFILEKADRVESLLSAETKRDDDADGAPGV